MIKVIKEGKTDFMRGNKEVCWNHCYFLAIRNRLFNDFSLFL